ncbi:MAG: hypothetical protein JW384_03276 [Nitrosomonadaceae bacterium]|nr:hypothetical protein [Nitrosomonadaceae bacterium]
MGAEAGQEGPPRGAFLPASLMQFYSGVPMHFVSGVDRDEHLHILTSGDICWFSEWQSDAVSRHGAIVYTFWGRSGRFIYVGMSGRGTQPDS